MALHNRRIIDDETWRIWSGGIGTAMSKTAFKQAWIRIKDDTQYCCRFEVFIDKLAAAVPVDEK
jgi:hypothetical protein